MSDATDQITRLMYTYAELMDKPDAGGLADLMAAAEVSDDRSGRVRRGRDEILAFYGGDQSRPDFARRTMHVTTNSIIDVDEDDGTATARSYYTVLGSGADGEARVLVAGRYHDRFRRVDRAWQFAARHYTADLWTADVLESSRARTT